MRKLTLTWPSPSRERGDSLVAVAVAVVAEGSSSWASLRTSPRIFSLRDQFDGGRYAVPGRAVRPGYEQQGVDVFGNDQGVRADVDARGCRTGCSGPRTVPSVLVSGPPSWETPSTPWHRGPVGGGQEGELLDARADKDLLQRGVVKEVRLDTRNMPSPDRRACAPWASEGPDRRAGWSDGCPSPC